MKIGESKSTLPQNAVSGLHPQGNLPQRIFSPNATFQSRLQMASRIGSFVRRHKTADHVSVSRVGSL
jgi:hypothetical protein